MTNIFQAAKDGDVAEITNLLKNSRISLDSKDAQGLTPLHWAASEGRVDAVRLLLENGANIDSKDDADETPLHLAVDRGFEEVIAVLLASGCDVDAQDNLQHTALHRAAALGLKEVVALLLQYSANVQMKNQNGWTPLHVSSYYCHHSISTALAEGNDVNIQNKDGWTPLHCCAKQGFTDIGKTLIHYGADVNNKSKDGNTPLHIAAQEGKLQFAELLLLYGANPNFTNAKGEKPKGTPEINNLLKSPPKIENMSSRNARITGDGAHKAVLDRLNSFSVSMNSKPKDLDIYVMFSEKAKPFRFLSFGATVNPTSTSGIHAWTVQYTPTGNTGLYQVFVKLGSEHVSGSPFNITVAKGESSGISRSSSSNATQIARRKSVLGEVRSNNSSFTSDIDEVEDLSRQITKLQQENLDLLQRNLKLEKQMVEMEKASLSTKGVNLKCVVCKNKDRNTLVLPCLHFLSCRSCLGGQSSCPGCQTVLCGFLKVKLTP